MYVTAGKKGTRPAPAPSPSSPVGGWAVAGEPSSSVPRIAWKTAHLFWALTSLLLGT